MKDFQLLIGIYEENVSNNIQTASYSSIKLKKLKDWADPIKRAAMKAAQQDLEDLAKKEIFTLEDQPWIRDTKPPFHINEGVRFKDDE